MMKVTMKHLLNLSKNQQALKNSSMRNTILETFEDIMNNQRFKEIPTMYLGQIPSLCTRIELQNPLFWRHLASELTYRLQKVPRIYPWVVSSIYYNYAVSFPHMNDEFFERIEERLVQDSNDLDIRTSSQTAWTLAKLRRNDQNLLEAIERRFVSECESAKPLDLAQILYAMSSFPTFGESLDFENAVKSTIRRLENDLKYKEITNIVCGLATKKKKYEGIVRELHQKLDIENMNFLAVKECAKSFSLFGRELEAVLNERISKFKETNSLSRNRLSTALRYSRKDNY